MLEGKRIIVTGAAQGIGASLAAGFAKLGAHVCLSDIADPASAADAITKQGLPAIAVQADITVSSECQRMVAATESAFGGVDGMVCNAALFSQLPAQPFDEIDEALWDKVMAVNVKGPWLNARAVVPAMERAGGGSIVMISSNRIYRGWPDLLHYDVSKGAVMAMTRSLIRELGPRGIRVNTIAPGLTMSEGVRSREGIHERAPLVAAQRSLARDQQPEDLIGSVAFFLSDHSAFVSGQSLIVDGGGLVQ